MLEPNHAGVVLKDIQEGGDANVIATKRLRGVEMRFAFLIALILATSPVAAQTTGTSTSQVCTQDPTYCSDTGAEPSTTTGAGTSSSASSGGSGGGSSGGASSGGGAAATPAVPNTPCGDGFPVDAWGGCN
jgi:hypothetical protein